MSLRCRTIERLFPTIAPANYERHSQVTKRYNCIAYAAGDLWAWWDPYAYWPPGATRGMKPEHLREAFECEGFQDCGMNDAFEVGFEKVALYWDGKDEWTHAARLRPDGWWESKCGKEHDILHRAPSDLQDRRYGRYGVVVGYMRRPLAAR